MRRFVGWVPFVGLQGGKEIRQVCSASDGIMYKKNFGYDLSKPLLGESLLISSGSFWKHHRKVSYVLLDPTAYLHTGTDNRSSIWGENTSERR